MKDGYTILADDGGGGGDDDDHVGINTLLWQQRTQGFNTNFTPKSILGKSSQWGHIRVHLGQCLRFNVHCLIQGHESQQQVLMSQSQPHINEVFIAG